MLFKRNTIEGTLKMKNMNEKYKPEYVESDLPPDQHEYQGWFWYMSEKKFYRWNDLPHRKDAIIKENEK